MNGWRPAIAIVLIVTLILAANRRPALQPLFRWLPVPLWCYALPLIAVALGWLPCAHPTYPALTTSLLPVALGCLLLNVDLPAVLRLSGRAGIAAGIGAAGIIAGTVLSTWLLQSVLPAESWKGAGALAGTWTGGTMNLLALRAVLEPPEPVFASLIIVDALIAYVWMALLVAASSAQASINQWLKATPSTAPPIPADAPAPSTTCWSLLRCAGLVAGLVWLCRAAAVSLPKNGLVGTATSWTILLVTTGTLALAAWPPIRRWGAQGAVLGYPCLYLVLAATGAQASLEALRAAPWWLVVGLGTVGVHAMALLGAGRLLRIPLGVLATASQANIGGVVSAPLVGAVYHQSLAPVGLLLAMAGNALGTYLGLLSATWCRWLLNT